MAMWLDTYMIQNFTSAWLQYESLSKFGESFLELYKSLCFSFLVFASFLSQISGKDTRITRELFKLDSLNCAISPATHPLPQISPATTPLDNPPVKPHDPSSHNPWLVNAHRSSQNNIIFNSASSRLSWKNWKNLILRYFMSLGKQKQTKTDKT